MLDVKFPIYSNPDPTDEEESEIEVLKKKIVRELFDETQESKILFEETIWSSEEYTGIILFNEICEWYKQKYGWHHKTIFHSICFFNGNNKDCDLFEGRLKGISQQYRLDKDAFKAGQANFFSKDNAENLKIWLKKDPYIAVLKTLGQAKTGGTAIELYEKLTDHSVNFTIRLMALRVLLENIVKHSCRVLPGMKKVNTRKVSDIIEELRKNQMKDNPFGTIEFGFAMTIQRICRSDIGAHAEYFSSDDREYKKYSDALDSLIAALKYLILWYGEISEKYK